MDYDRCGEILDDIADSMPLELFRELNGGVVLCHEWRYHPMAVDNDLYILGVYVRDNLGRRIKIYYGSVIRVFPNKTDEEYKEILRRILAHELKHHNEYLAGCNDLVYYDDSRIAAYLEKKGYSDKR